jgi:hypothetical protein
VGVVLYAHVAPGTFYPIAVPVDRSADIVEENVRVVRQLNAAADDVPGETVFAHGDNLVVFPCSSVVSGIVDPRLLHDDLATSVVDGVVGVDARVPEVTLRVVFAPLRGMISRTIRADFPRPAFLAIAGDIDDAIVHGA